MSDKDQVSYFPQDRPAHTPTLLTKWHTQWDGGMPIMWVSCGWGVKFNSPQESKASHNPLTFWQLNPLPSRASWVQCKAVLLDQGTNCSSRPICPASVSPRTPAPPLDPPPPPPLYVAGKASKIECVQWKVSRVEWRVPTPDSSICLSQAVRFFWKITTTYCTSQLGLQVFLGNHLKTKHWPWICLQCPFTTSNYYKVWKHVWVNVKR